MSAPLSIWLKFRVLKNLDEKAASLHLLALIILIALGAQLTSPTKEQADYIGITPEGPFKPDAFR